MNTFKEISPYELENAMKLIGKDWNITEGEWVDIHKREIDRVMDKIRV